MSDFNRSAAGGSTGTGTSVSSDSDMPAGNTAAINHGSAGTTGTGTSPSTSPAASTSSTSTPSSTTTAGGTSGGASSGSTGSGNAGGQDGSATDKAKGAAQTLKDEAGKLRGQAADRARGFADEGKMRATGALDDFSRMIEDAAATVDEKMGEQYGQYARQAAKTVSDLSEQIRNKEVDELVEDTRAFVRKSPAVAIGTAAALGFLIARVVKAGVDASGATPADKA